jgi:hypothetical protein
MLPRDKRIRARLLILTPREHKYTLPLVRPILPKVLLLQPISLLPVPLMDKPTEEIRSTRIQLLRLADIVVTEATLYEMRRLTHERNSLFEIVDQVNVAVFVGAVDERQFDRRAAVAAVEEDVEDAVTWESGDQVSV